MTDNIEKIIKQELHSLDDGIDMASNGAYLEGCPLFVVYYDKENKGCLMLDAYNLSDVRLDNEDMLLEFVYKHPERFVRVPHEIASHDYNLMEEFAYMKKNPKLIRALQGRRPMRTFNYLVAELGLENEWRGFRLDSYEEEFNEWKVQNGI